MQIAKSFCTVRKNVKVAAGRRADISGLPFAPGSEVDVILVGPSTVKAGNAGKIIYDYTDSLTKSKRLPRYSLKHIEEIIDDSRLSRGSSARLIRREHTYIGRSVEGGSARGH